MRRTRSVHDKKLRVNPSDWASHRKEAMVRAKLLRQERKRQPEISNECDDSDSIVTTNTPQHEEMRTTTQDSREDEIEIQNTSLSLPNLTQRDQSSSIRRSVEALNESREKPHSRKGETQENSESSNLHHFPRIKKNYENDLSQHTREISLDENRDSSRKLREQMHHNGVTIIPEGRIGGVVQPFGELKSRKQHTTRSGSSIQIKREEKDTIKTRMPLHSEKPTLHWSHKSANESERLDLLRERMKMRRMYHSGDQKHGEKMKAQIISNKQIHSTNVRPISEDSKSKNSEGVQPRSNELYRPLKRQGDINDDNNKDEKQNKNKFAQMPQDSNTEGLVKRSPQSKITNLTGSSRGGIKLVKPQVRRNGDEDDDDSYVSIETIYCKHCDKSFAPPTFEKLCNTLNADGEPKCIKMYNSKRKVYCAAKVRISRNEHFSKEEQRVVTKERKKIVAEMKSIAKGGKRKKAKRSKWKEQSKSFREAMEVNNLIAKAEREGKPSSYYL
mmetsp:Transcript_61069/g.73438  ORF Transcript_61069/g.73438 Transcript_61069/m.73438 type:complete len:501 (-) Transcript_61069:613-2115(-)